MHAELYSIIQSASCEELQMAEVCFAGDGAAGASYGLPADIWAVGVLACELLMGASPFEGDTKEETYAKILAGDVRLPGHLSPGAQDFIRKVCSSF